MSWDNVCNHQNIDGRKERKKRVFIVAFKKARMEVEMLLKLGLVEDEKGSYLRAGRRTREHLRRVMVVLKE